MNELNRHRVLSGSCLLAGLMDASSGLLLMLNPGFTLALMRVPAVTSETWVFVRFVGAFVFSVGCLYLFAFRSVSLTQNWSYVRFVFGATAWVRAVICIFTTLAILQGALAVEWGSVPLTDGILACFQVLVVWSGWIPDKDAIH
jgi:hypothetical protein